MKKAKSSSLLYLIVTLLAACLFALTLAACSGGKKGEDSPATVTPEPPIVTEYTLTFLVDGAPYAVRTVKAQERVTLPDDPTKEGYEFAGWYLDDETFARLFDPSEVVESLTLYANWREKTPPPHEHRFGDWQRVSEATCTESGSETRICSECFLIETRDIPPLEHDWGDWTGSILPTCTEEGEEIRTCRRDSWHTERRAIPALGHTPESPRIEGEREATCTEAGGWDEVTYCAVCEREISRVERQTPALGHDWSEWSRIGDPTCTEAGEEMRVCMRDDSHIDHRSIPALGHSPEAPIRENAFDPTCTEAGGYEEVIYCATCRGEISRERIVLPPLGHVEVIDPREEATCLETGLGEGKHCSRCRQVLVIQEVLPPLGHDWGWVTDQAATKKATGLGHEECARCHALRSEGTLLSRLPCDHEDIWHVSLVQPTCEEAGRKEHWHCFECERYFADSSCTTEIEDFDAYAPIPALEHLWGDWILTTEPTCTGAGEETRYCDRDHDHKDTRAVDPLGHTFGARVEEVPATHTSSGFAAHYRCTRCEGYFDLDQKDTTDEALFLDRIPCILTFDLNGATSGSQSPLYILYDASLPTIRVDLVRTGYLFAGYNCEGADYFDEEGAPLRSWEKDGDAVLVAKWTPKTYVVTLQGNRDEGSSSALQAGDDTFTATYGADAPDFTPASMLGWTLLGYFTAPNGGTQVLQADGTFAVSAAGYTDGDGHWACDRDNVILYARWTPSLYPILFDANGGEGAQESITTAYDRNIKTNLDVSITRVGYTFDGYWSAASGGVRYFTQTGSSVDTEETIWRHAEARTLYAHWTPEEYSVTFDVNGAGGVLTSPRTITGVRYGEPMPDLSDRLSISRVGYTFLGFWDDGEEGDRYYDREGKSVKAYDKAANATLYAHWAAKSYTLSLDPNGGSAESSEITVFYDALPDTLLEAPTLAYHLFDGYWSAAEGGTQYFYANLTAVRSWDVDGDTTLYAHWRSGSYRILFHANDGSGNTQELVRDCNESYSMPASYWDPDGYTFSKWNTASDGKGTDYQTGASYLRLGDNGEQVDLYALWTPIAYRVILSDLLPVAEDFESLSDRQIVLTFGEIAADVTPLSAEGYTFAGYYGGMNGEGKQYFDRAGKGVAKWDRAFDDTRIYGYWIPDEYELTFDANGGEGAGEALTVGYRSTFPEIEVLPTRAKYDFVGYFTAAEGGTPLCFADGSPTGEVWTETSGGTLYAHWTKASYTVLYDGNGANAGETASSTYFCLTSDALRYNGYERTGYLFGGWSTAADGSAALYDDGQAFDTDLADAHETLTLYAQWTPREYLVDRVTNIRLSHTLTFDLNGGEGETPAPQVVDLVTSPTLPYVRRSGYAFAGWYDNAACEGTPYDTSVSHDEDVTLYAGWIAFFSTDEELNAALALTEEERAIYATVTHRESLSIGDLLFAGMTAEIETDGTTLVYYPIVFPETATYVIYSRGAGDHDLCGYIYTSSLMQIDLDDGGSDRHFRIERTFESDTLYYLAVREQSAALGGRVEICAERKEQPLTVAPHTPQKIAAVPVVYGEQFSLGVPLTEGYTFHGWYDGIGGSGRQYTDEKGEGVRAWDIAADAVLYAYWTPATYTLSFDGNGGTGGTTEILATYLAAAPAIVDAPVRENYDFLGYFSAAEGGDLYYRADLSATFTLWTGTSDLTLYAHWQGKAYTVLFDGKGGAGEMSEITMYYATESALPPSTYTRTGYAFEGWDTDPQGGVAVYLDEQRVADLTAGGGVITLYAVWSPKSYTLSLDTTVAHTVTVTFDLNGGSGMAPAAQIVTQDNGVRYPEIPEREGYLFAGWYDDAACTGEPFDFTAALAEDVKLYASWVALGAYDDLISLGSTYDVTLDGVEERRIPILAFRGQVVLFYSTSSTDTLCRLYDADGALLAENDDADEDLYGTSLGKNFCLTYALEGYRLYYFAVRGANEESVGGATIHLHGDASIPAAGGKAGTRWLADRVVTYGSMQDLPIDEIVGYTFGGWYDGEGGTGRQYADENGVAVKAWDIAGNATLYAKQTPSCSTVTFDAQGGESVQADVAATYGEEMPAITVMPAREGYLFAGFRDALGVLYYQADLTSARSWDKVGDSVLYACWTEAAYTLFFDPNGASGASYAQRIACGEERSLLTNEFLRKGYDLVGWNTAANGGGDHYDAGATVCDLAAAQGVVTLYAEWAAHTIDLALDLSYAIPVTVHFDTNGSSSSIPDQIVTGTVGLTYPLPEREGYLFCGWYRDAACSQPFDAWDQPLTAEEKDLTLYAYWVDASAYTILTGGALTDTEIDGTNERYYAFVSRFDQDIVIYTTGGADTYGVLQDYFRESTVYASDDDGGEGENFRFVYHVVHDLPYLICVRGADPSASGTAVLHVEAIDGVNSAGGISEDRTLTLFSMTYDSEEYDLPVPTRDGYAFDGWWIGNERYTDAAGHAVRAWDVDRSGARIYAYWIGDSYTVTLDKQGGEGGFDEIIVTYGDSAYVGVLPAKEGYDFAGYWSAAEGGVCYSGESLSRLIAWDRTEDSTLYAHWTPKRYVVTMAGGESSTAVVSFDLNGAAGVAPSAQVVGGDTFLTYPEIPTREGYLFAGWYDQASCVGEAYDFSAAVIGEITLYAKWGAYAEEYAAISYGDPIEVTCVGRAYRYFPVTVLFEQEITFFSEGEIDAYALLLDGAFRVIATDDDGAADGKGNFRLTYTLRPGELYYLVACAFRSDEAGIITVTLTAEGTLPSDGGAYDGSEGRRAVVFTGESFVLPVPAGEGAFLGWYTEEEGGARLTDEYGVSLSAWSIPSDITIYAHRLA